MKYRSIMYYNHLTHINQKSEETYKLKWNMFEEKKYKATCLLAVTWKKKLSK